MARPRLDEEERRTHRFFSQVVDRRRGADSLFLAASRKEGVPYGLAGSHSGHPDAGQAKAQDPAETELRETPTKTPMIRKKWIMGCPLE